MPIFAHRWQLATRADQMVTAVRLRSAWDPHGRWGRIVDRCEGTARCSILERSNFRRLVVTTAGAMRGPRPTRAEAPFRTCPGLYIEISVL